MAGYFKLVDAHDDGFRVKLTAPDGTLVAVSAYYTSKEEAVAGIELIREIAGTGPVVDHSRVESQEHAALMAGLQSGAEREGAVRHKA
ncbi:YegP family protein [Arthrobacter sp. L77]|uniref:YegP family protein n=1 Tax=Arthrobacter sp. L77 TaxID=1496689 RepID=UPI00069133E6|nr:YegP family protein [Arthrobacter sp. L77]